MSKESLYPFYTIGALTLGSSLIKNNTGSKSTDERETIWLKDSEVMFRMETELRMFESGINKILNLLPHSIKIKNSKDRTIRMAACRAFARIRTIRSEEDISHRLGFGGLFISTPDIERVNIYFPRKEALYIGRFPSPEVVRTNPFFKDVYFLVSRITASAMRDYDNVLTVGESKMGENTPTQERLVTQPWNPKLKDI
jgi:hypothetical protein